MEKQSLYHLVKDIVATFAERPIYWVKAEQQNFQAVSFYNWRSDMKRFSAYLLYSLKVGHGDRIAFFCNNRYEWNMVCLGINTIGAVDVPCDRATSSGEINYILEQTKCRIAIVENQKTLTKLIEVLPKLPQLKEVISIEPLKHYEQIEEVKKRMGKVRLHFLIDTLSSGKNYLHKNGEDLLYQRGEAIRPHDLTTILYTNGSTKVPRGVMLTHGNFCWSVSQIQYAVSMNERDRAIVYLPPWCIVERILEMVLMSFGASMAPSQIGSLLSDLSTMKPSLLFSMPQVWEDFYKKIFDTVDKEPSFKKKLFHFACNTASTYTDIVDTLLDRFAEWEKESQTQRLLRKLIASLMLPFYALLNVPAQRILRQISKMLGGNLRFAISEAGTIPERVSLFFRSIGIPILDAYGRPETTGLGVLGEFPYPRRGVLGKPFPGVQTQLREANGNIVSWPGGKGILYHKGPHVMQGYYNEEKQSQEVLQDGWLNSGDIFTRTNTGYLRFSSRAKDTSASTDENFN